MGLKNAWQRLKTIWNFAVGALIGGAGVAAYYFWFAAHPSNPRAPDQVMVAPVPSPGPLPGAGPPPGWHFVPNGMEGCVDKYGCARPSFDSDFWKWVSTGEEGCADEHGCARPRLPGKGDATPPRQAVEKPEGPGKKGEKPGAQSESDAGPQPGGGPLPAEHELPSKPPRAGGPPDAAQQRPATPPPDRR
jgi:hypothetical protein